MSGTSLDGVDGVILQADPEGLHVTHAHHLPMPEDLRRNLLDLNSPGHNEIHLAALATNRLMQIHAQVVKALLGSAKLKAIDISAIGVHGQTIRHQPGPVGACVDPQTPWWGYTVQLCNPALLAELCGMTVVSDFRSRDVAAGGQGAPLVPAFHQALFGQSDAFVAVVNVGGMANVSLLAPGQDTLGFDTGPGNVLMDLWCEAHTGRIYDADGAWAASGHPHDALLEAFLAEPYFSQRGARSTGRDLFNRHWLDSKLRAFTELPPQDVQATLLALTVQSISKAIPPGVTRCVVCGGGALNGALMQGLRQRLHPTNVSPSGAWGMPPMEVEAAAFAWLARQTLLGLPGNVPQVTGARGPRVLGTIHPA